MLYKRIAKNLYDSALYPIDVDTQQIVEMNGGVKIDFYDSIYLYDEGIYNKYNSAVKEYAEELGVQFEEQNPLKTVEKINKIIRFNNRKEEAKERGLTFAGITDVKTNRLVFDFDSETDIEKSKKDTLTICGRLIQNQVPQDAIRICFSGNKGFSVEVFLNHLITRKEFENLTRGLAEGLETFDQKVSDQQRVFRVPLTVNSKSGLVKMPLTLEELSNFSREQANHSYTPAHVVKNKKDYLARLKETNSIDLPPALQEKMTSKENHPSDDVVFDDRLELSRKPNWLSSTKFALQEGFFENGSRNEAFMILCSTYRANGFPKEIAYRMLKGVAELQAKRTGSEQYSNDALWTQVVQSIYSPTWRGGTYSERENSLLKKTAERFGLSLDRDKVRLTTIEEGLSRFDVFGQQFLQNKINFGINTIDENLLVTTQMTIGILGAPSSGKTTIAMNMIEGVLESGENVLFESLDMGEYNIMARFLSKYCGMGYKQILEEIHSGKKSKKLLQAWDIVKEKYKNLGVTYRSGTSVDDIEQDIIDYTTLTGRRPKLVVIDYLEKVRGPYSDDTANSGYVASRLSDLATEYDTCMLLLLQPQKHAGDPSDPLLSMRKVKGSSKIEQDCRVILTIWRPGFDPSRREDEVSNDNFMSMAVVKNNMGQNYKWDFYFDGAKGQVRDLTYEEEKELQAVISAQNEKKEAEQKKNKLDF